MVLPKRARKILRQRLYIWRVSKPVTRLFGPRFIPHPNRIEIDITYDCNLKCLNCNRSCRLAASQEGMSLAQIDKFIQESISTQRKWEWIHVLGGEPTLHPDILKIIDSLLSYKRSFSPETRVRLFTNGFGNAVNSMLERLPELVEIVSTNKTDRSGKNIYSEHLAFTLAPLDLKAFRKSDFINACGIPYYCGIGLTRFGYYQCTIAGGIDRVFGFGKARKNLPSPEENFTDLMEIFCRHCGHFSCFSTDRKQKISSSWKEAYQSYKKKKPSLPLY